MTQSPPNLRSSNRISLVQLIVSLCEAKGSSTGKMVLQLSGCYWHPCFLCDIDYMFLGLSLLVFA